MAVLLKTAWTTCFYYKLEGFFCSEMNWAYSSLACHYLQSLCFWHDCTWLIWCGEASSSSAVARVRMTSLKVTSLWNKCRSHSLENTLAWPAEEQKEWAVKTQWHTWRHTDGLLTSCTEIFHWDYGQCSGIGLSFTQHGIWSFLYVPSVPDKLGNLKKRHKEPIRLTKQNKTTPYRIVEPL